MAPLLCAENVIFLVPRYYYFIMLYADFTPPPPPPSPRATRLARNARSRDT